MKRGGTVPPPVYYTCTRSISSSGAVLADVIHVRPGALFFLQAHGFLRFQHFGDRGIRIVLVAENARLGRTGFDARGVQAVAGAVIAEGALLHHARLADPSSTPRRDPGESRV